jgi:hypothetical protein
MPDHAKKKKQFSKTLIANLAHFGAKFGKEKVFQFVFAINKKS